LSYWQDVLSQAQTELTYNAHQQQLWSAKDSEVIIPGPWKSPTCFWKSVTTGEIYRVDEATDILSPAELLQHEQEVIKADRDEVHMSL
jgi:hypothetical protein